MVLGPLLSAGRDTAPELQHVATSDNSTEPCSVSDVPTKLLLPASSLIASRSDSSTEGGGVSGTHERQRTTR